MSSIDEKTQPSERTKLIEKLAQHQNSCWGIIKEKILSRKLLAFAVSTWLFFIGALTEEAWMMITMTYIGGQGIVDLMKVWKGL